MLTAHDKALFKALHAKPHENAVKITRVTLVRPITRAAQWGSITYTYEDTTLGRLRKQNVFIYRITARQIDELNTYALRRPDMRFYPCGVGIGWSGVTSDDCETPEEFTQDNQF